MLCVFYHKDSNHRDARHCVSIDYIHITAPAANQISSLQPSNSQTLNSFTAVIPPTTRKTSEDIHRSITPHSSLITPNYCFIACNTLSTNSITKKSLTQILSLLFIGLVSKKKRNEARSMDEMNMFIATECRSGALSFRDQNIHVISTDLFGDIHIM
jgi:hypothetical protein